MKEVKILCFYKPHQYQYWNFSSYYEDSKELTIEHEINSEYVLDIVIDGISDSISQSSTYSSLIQTLDIQVLSIQKVMEMICESCSFDDHPKIPSNTIMLSSQALNSESIDKDNLIVCKVVFHKFSISRICKEYEVSSLYVRRLLKEFKNNIKLIKRDNKRYLGKRQKLDEDSITVLNEEASSLMGTKFTANDLKCRFIKRTKNLIGVSERTIKRVMKANLKLRYKKCGLLNKVVNTQPGVRQIIEAITLQLAFEKKGLISVYIDEFKFSSESYTEYGWVKRGTKGYHFINKSNFNMSFMIGFCLRGVEGVVATNGTFNSRKFRKFVCDIFKGDPANLVLIMDNAKIHKADIVNKFCRDSDILAVTIPPYSPFCNPCEKLILRIKSSARKIKASGRIVTLQKFKDIIDNLQPESFAACVKESWIEAYHFLKNYAMA